MRLLFLCLILVAFVLSNPVLASDAAPSVQTATESFFPLGVYFPWETTQVAGEGISRSARLQKFLEERLDDLAAHNVNLVWTVNGPGTPGELGLLCRLADERGIRIVAGSAEWSMQRHNATLQFMDEALQHIRRVWRALDGKPRPLAFTLSDEPQAHTLPLFARYVQAVRDGGIPTTTVVQWHTIEPATRQVRALDYLAADIYPFFGSDAGPRGDASYEFYIRHARNLAQLAPQAGAVPWMMAQAFQEILGPMKENPDGTVTVLKGGGTHWIMPTPAQIRWQVWTAAATGNKGILFFTYGSASRPDPGVAPIQKDWAERAPKPTGAPLSLVSWPTYRPSRQYEAMAAAYAELRPLIPLLQRIEAAQFPGEPIRIEGAIAGDVVSHLRDRITGQRYVAVVASPQRAEPGIRLLSNDRVSGLPESRRIELPLEPGQGAIYLLDRVTSER